MAENNDDFMQEASDDLAAVEFIKDAGFARQILG